MEFLLIFLHIFVNITIQDTNCYNELGCFPNNYPWFSMTRPFYHPESPQKVNTKVFFVSRTKPVKIPIRTWPKIMINRDLFDPKKPTLFLVHGYKTYINSPIITTVVESILFKGDFNIFLIDWSQGARKFYLQSASNTRITAAEIVRLIRFLQLNFALDVSRLHLMGHSLGAHIMSYVGKQIPGIARITAIDPAEPGFEGKDSRVRLDSNDAKFIDVIHTDGKPFFGLGYRKSIGNVDFFVNGGEHQPDCLMDNKSYNISFWNIHKVAAKVIHHMSVCSHIRSFRYMAAAIKEECPMWGHRYYERRSRNRYEDFVSQKPCTPEDCTLMGLRTPEFPARGNFVVRTSGKPPYCIREDYTTKRMSKVNLTKYFE